MLSYQCGNGWASCWQQPRLPLAPAVTGPGSALPQRCPGPRRSRLERCGGPAKGAQDPVLSQTLSR